VSDEPSNWELARSLNDIKLMLAGLVSRAEYTEFQRNVQYRFDALARDIADERREREKALEAANDRMDKYAQSASDRQAKWHDRLWQGALPALVAAVGVLVTILIQHGGH
jgi:heme oxygenase